jgi:hypothetical protein
MSLCAPVRTEHLGSEWKDFQKIRYLNIFRKLVEKNQVSLKSNRDNGSFTWRPVYSYDNRLYHWILLKIGNVSDTRCRSNQNTFMFSNVFSENRLVYEIMWKNIIHLDRPQMTIWGMRVAYWITKATDTLWICNTYCVSTAKILSRTSRDVTLYGNCLSCLTSFNKKNHTPR